MVVLGLLNQINGKTYVKNIPLIEYGKTHFASLEIL